MIREIDLTQYLPPFLVEYKELKKILEVENARLQAIENIHWNMVDNRFILTADEYGIARYEKMMGITAQDNDTLDDRRFRIMSQWNKELPYNYAYLFTQLKTLCGDDNFTMKIENMVLTIKIGLSSKKQYNAVAELLDAIVPCAVLIDLGLLYNTHEVLSGFTHAQLSVYNHRQLRSEVLGVPYNDYGDLVGMTHAELSAFTHDQIFKKEGF